MSGWQIVDSSGWIEYFTDGPNAGQFADPINSRDAHIVSTIAIYEVSRWLDRKHGREAADLAVAMMNECTTINVDSDLAVDAASFSIVHQLAMADAIILSTARRFDATLWTQDADFKGLDGVRYVPKAT